MKKINTRIAALLSASALLAALLAGCAQASADSSKNGASSALYPAAAKSASSSAAVASQPVSAPSASSQAAAAGSDSLLSEEQARQIVLEHAGLTQDQVTFVTFELDRDHGRSEYELEFYAGNEEYDYEIDASTGEILSFDRDMEAQKPAAAQSGTRLSADQAQSAALTHAGLSQADVTGLRTELDRDDGRQLYEVEFHVGYTEYDYEIDAFSGEVISYSVEQD